MGNSAVLDQFAVLRTQDVCEARSAVAQRYCDHKLSLRRGRRINMCYNHVRGAHVSLNVLGYGGDVHINPGLLRDFYLLQIPIVGRARVSHRGEEIEAGPDRATILNPDRPTEMEWRADCTKLMLQIDAAFLNRVAGEEVGAALPGPVRFDPGVELNTQKGRALRSLILATARAYDNGSLSPDRQSLRELSAERSIARAVLQWQPSNVTQCLESADTRAKAAVLPAVLRRSVEFIHEHYHRDLRLDEIALVCGAHPRTLQAGFRDMLGMTPMSYLKKVRLDAARYRLSVRRDRESVTDVAYGCGFAHLGRFSRDYRARFGHSPRDTV